MNNFHFWALLACIWAQGALAWFALSRAETLETQLEAANARIEYLEAHRITIDFLKETNE